MFTKPVVLVVGAGASSELKLPLGSQLRNLIAGDVNLRFNHGRHESGSAELMDALRRIVSSDHLSAMTQAGRRLSPTMIAQPSVDEALFYFAGDADVVNLGKIAIANRILLAERGSELPAWDDYEGTRKFPAQNGQWLFLLFSLLVRGTRRAGERSFFENLTVINFNYDRTLEQYFFLALQRNADLSREEAIAAMRGIRQLKPYGSLGPLDWQTDPGIPYGAAEAGHAAAASSNIRTFTEQFDNDQMRSEIADSLGQAELIIFLGFGYHHQNMEILQRPKKSTVNQTALVLATTLGLHEANNDGIRRSISNWCRIDHSHVFLFQMSASGVLTELQPTILEKAG